VGSLLGLSSWIWAKSAAPSVIVHCFDLWEKSGSDGNFGKLAAAHGQTLTRAQFLANVADCPNIRTHQGYSPDDFLDWREPIDLYFDDAVHINPMLSDNLDFWCRRLKPNGIICGHDYADKFPDVRSGAKRLAQQYGRCLQVIGSFWLLLPRTLSEATDPAIRRTLAVLEALERTSGTSRGASSVEPLSEQAVAEATRAIVAIPSLACRIEIDDAQKGMVVPLGGDLVLRGNIRNTSGCDWPVRLNPACYLEIGAELYAGDDGRKLAAARYNVDGERVRAGQTVAFELRLATLDGRIGPASCMVDALYRGVTWFAARGNPPTKLSLQIVPSIPSRRVDPSQPERRGVDALSTEDDIEAMFKVLLKRAVNNDKFKKDMVAKKVTLRQLVAGIRESDELKYLMQADYSLHTPAQQLDLPHFRVPQDFVVTPLDVRRVLIVGSCLSEAWARRMAAMQLPCETDVYLLGRALPESPARPIGEYNFQIVQLGLRFILPDASFARLSQTDTAGHEKLFTHAVNAMRQFLDASLRWNQKHGILTFVFSFIVPQQNLVGRLMPRYDLRNPVYFIEKLNEALVRELDGYSNTYFFDLNEIIATYGRRYVQEDAIAAFNHGGFLGNYDFQYDQNRLEPTLKATDLYEERLSPIVLAVWDELVSMYRTVSQSDMVKMVVIDLDDTLWRGVVAELSVDELPTSEGWPKGLWEALAFLKRRGILLAIISKNEEARVVEVWDSILRNLLTLDDFAIRRINWHSKAENMAEILAHVNLLPRNVIYIDDDPAKRAEIKAAFPDIRVLGGNPLTWRRILLWSAETQLPDVTAESASRTEMVRAQVVREEQRQSMSREEFLATLNVRMNLFLVENVAHTRLPRVLELINKTNQFNTTGQRWTREECIAAFADGTRFYAFEVTDRYTDYGLVGVLIVEKIGIRQFVMSCRIMGLEAEVAAVAQIIEISRARGDAVIVGALVETDRNLPCRDLYSRCGFEATRGVWQRATIPPLPIPAHITLTVPGMAGVERKAGG
jgi:FkbH-like protein